MARLVGMSIELHSFLDTIAFSELGEKMTNDPRTDEGYKVIVGSLPGSLILLEDYEDHPNRLVKINNRLSSTAAGRYQILYRFWEHYKMQLNLPDFSPESQDRYAIQQFKERRALDDIEAGRVEQAIVKCSNIWASFPGAGYGQYEHDMDKLLRFYHKQVERYKLHQDKMEDWYDRTVKKGHS